MAETQLTIWTNARFPEEVAQRLAGSVGPHRLVSATETTPQNLSASPIDPRLGEADVAFGQPDPSQIATLPALQWIHLTSAGYTPYDRDDLRQSLRKRNARLTTSSGVYDDPCAEHLAAMMLALARQLPQAWHTQFTDRAWPWKTRREASYLLRGQSVVIFGFGAIATRLAEILAPFEMRLVGVRRTVHGDEPIRAITDRDVPAFLAEADHVVNVLPLNDSSKGYFDAARFRTIKHGARFYNVGRGATVDQEALAAALANGRLAAAYLDVTTPEPLPPDHPLWRTANCYITPHSAGGQDDEMNDLVDHFLENLRRFVAGEPLRNQVI